MGWRGSGCPWVCCLVGGAGWGDGSKLSNYKHFSDFLFLLLTKVKMKSVDPLPRQ